jgi:hypothetical protein
MSAPEPARKPSKFYSSVLDEKEQAGLVEAMQIEGIDEEIAMLRVAFRKRVKHEELQTIAKAVNSIVRAVRARHALTPQDAEAVKRQLVEELQAAARAIDHDREARDGGV